MVIQSRLTPPDWTDDEGGGEDSARCLNFDISRDDDGIVRNDAWFQDAENAVSVCNGEFASTPCPVRESCLLWSLVNNDQHGVFGGMTVPQRRWIRRNIPKERWKDVKYIREIVPPMDYFHNVGNEDPDEEVRKDAEAAAKYQAEQAARR